MIQIRPILIAAALLLAVPAVQARIAASDLDPYIFGDSLTITANSRISADSLRHIRKHTAPSAQRVEATRMLGDYFLERHTDSAFIYLNMAGDEARSLGLDSAAMLIRMRIDGYMPFLGMGAEGYTDFKEIDPSAFSEELKRAYFLASCELHHNLAMKYPESAQRNRNIIRTVEAIDSLLPFYAPESTIYRYLYAYRTLMNGDKSIAAAALAELLPELRDKPALYVRACVILADFYENNPNRRDEYFDYLLEAAIVSLKNGIVRPTLMAKLGKELYLNGDEKRGARCIYLAFRTNDYEQGLYRLNKTGEYAGMLTSRGNKMLTAMTAVSIIALLIITALAFMLISERRKAALSRAAAEAETNKYREELQRLRNQRREYLSLAFSTLEYFKEFNRYVHRKLTAGQAKDLFKEVENGRWTQTQADKFFEEFDTLFLKNGDGFLERLNALLQPGQALSLLPGNKMSPEIRIAALMSLGISDSQLIASVLGLSLNTVYTYRNRLKGRALNRAEFENQIREINETP